MTHLESSPFFPSTEINRGWHQLQELNIRFDVKIQLDLDREDLSGRLASVIKEACGTGELSRQLTDFIYNQAIDFMVSASPRCLVQLKTVLTNNCRYFHADNLKKRWVTTFYGPGTETLLPSEKDWEHFFKGEGQALEFPRGKIIAHKACEVIRLKGRKHRDCLEDTRQLTLHRSPEIESIGEERLVLKIDSVT